MTEFAAVTEQRIQEAALLIEPEVDRDIFDVLHEANLRGYRSITVHENNTATVLLFERDTEGT